MERYKFNIGNKMIGQGCPCLIQSMGDRKTTEVDYLVSETNTLASIGLDMMRFSILDEADTRAIKEIKKRTNDDANNTYCHNAVKAFHRNSEYFAFISHYPDPPLFIKISQLLRCCQDILR